MSYYVLNRDYLLRSTFGHSISFEKGNPTYVPPMVVPEVVAIGGELVEGEVPELIKENKPVEELGFAARAEEINAAFKTLVDRNDAADFTGQGSPNVNAMNKLLSFTTDRAEIDGLWNTWKLQQAGAL